MTAQILSFAPGGAGLGGSRVCVAVAGASVEELLERAARVLADERMIELRLDALPEPMLALPALPSLLAEFPEARIVATCRRREAGGGFGGSIDDELAVLTAAAGAGCAIVDLALETAEEMRLEQHRMFRATLHQAGTALLISYHDYRGTRDLALTMSRLERHQPELIKIVSTANALSDNLPILKLLGQRHGRPVVAIAMGEAGIVSRVLGPRCGGLFTFASSGAGAETAPGQVTADTLRNLYRIDEICSSTSVYGVAGQPISHSLSPLLHNTGFRDHGVDAVFLPLPTESIHDLLRLARELPIEGLSITMPLKQVVLPLLDYVDPLAARVGACNTVVRAANGELRGYNTDVAGVTAPLEKRLSLKGARVLVQGAGGAARAAVFGLRDKGAEVWIANRTIASAEALAAESGAGVADAAMLAAGGFDVLVNATPAGMWAPGLDGSPDAGLDEARLPAKLIFDMVYRPLETPLIIRARAQGLAAITGVEMFVHQGARQFELWTGNAAPEEEMFRVVLEALAAKRHLDIGTNQENHGQA